MRTRCSATVARCAATTKLSADWAQRYRAFAAGSGRDVAQRLDGALSQMSNLVRGLLLLSMAAAGAEAYQNAQDGMPASEAVARSGVNFTADLVVGGVPLLAASEIAGQVLFGTGYILTGDKGFTDAAPSNVIKALAQATLDQVVAGACASGEYVGGARAADRGQERHSRDPGQRRPLAGPCRAGPHGGAAGGSRTGAPQEWRLLRMRAAFRLLLRAGDPETQ